MTKKRTQLYECSSFDDAVAFVRKASKIIVLTGAGISTSLGIPDFRSAGGLYDQLRADPKCKYEDPQDLFRLETFQENPLTFYQMVARRMVAPLSRDGVTPRFTPTHAFLRLLQDKSKLLRNYTQNIDGLEAAAGIKASILQQVHGTIATGRCMRCGKTYSKNFRAVWDKGFVPRCGRCLRERETVSQSGRKRKHRSDKKPRKKRANQHWDETSDESEEVEVDSILRPDIIFFGEELSEDYKKSLEDDGPEADLLIVIGSSLQVKPLSQLPLQDSIKSKPFIYISKEALQGNILPDIQLIGSCDVVVRELARRLGWELKHEMIDDSELTTIKTELLEGTWGQILVKEQASRQPKVQESAANESACSTPGKERARKQPNTK